ncbi:unnamed protein product [Sphagnum troendelagicum]|uniref:Uncharacterized protein n=1 Tax=Sphagnum troendelagicum TaxID=128251 RepID=A0ABP0TDW5_9BRYO
MLATCFTGRRDAMATEKTSFLLDEEAGSITTAIAAAAVVPTLIAQTANDDDDDVVVRDSFLDNTNKAIIDKAELEEESVRDADGSGQQTMHRDEEEANLKGENQTAEEAEQDMAEEQKTDAAAGAAVIKVEKTDQEKEDAEEMSEALRVEGDQATLEHQQQQRDGVPNGELKVVKEPAAAAYQNDKKRVQGLVQERQKKQCRRGGGHATTIDERKKDEEDVCYICFDGGDLVMCDRRSCPKAYHLNCIGRDAAFFKKKGAWICGWHFCSSCTKPGSFQCYTCPIAYCGSCVKEANFFMLRKRKGLCEECLPIVIMIEHNQTVNSEGVEVDFEDKETYEFLFKEYWLGLKNRLSLTMPELDKDGKPANENHADSENGGSDTENQDPSDVDELGTESDRAVEESDEDGDETLDGRKWKRKKIKFAPTFEDWASKEVLDFIIHMKGDPLKPLTRFAVNHLLWSYIKQHQLQDPGKKINCDERLQVIFGKKLMGQSEMYRQLKEHFPPKESVSAAKSAKEADRIVKDEAREADGAEDKLDRATVKDKRRGRRRSDEKFERPDGNDFAAITPKNINLIYLRRSLLEDLLDDPEFDSKVVDTFVKIRVPGNASTLDTCYRLVLITGTRLQTEFYKAGRKLTNIVLDILNLQKKEELTIDLVSNQDFSEEECQRLRQSIKCGFLKTLTVGQLEAKAIALQEAKVNDWLETERQRLVNLRDRANGFSNHQTKVSPGLSWEKGSVAPYNRRDSSAVEDSSFGGRKGDWDSHRYKPYSTRGSNGSRDWVQKGHETGRSSEKSFVHDINSSQEKSSWHEQRGGGRDWTKDHRDYVQEQQNDQGGADNWKATGKSRSDHWGGDSIGSKFAKDEFRTPIFDQPKLNTGSLQREPVGPASTVLPPLSNIRVTSPERSVLSQADLDIMEREKVWHYQDPTGTSQGPFSMEQLRKWNTTGLFPVDLRIRRTGQTHENSILLTNALAGRFAEERGPWTSNIVTGLQSSNRDRAGGSSISGIGEGRVSTWGVGRGIGDDRRWDAKQDDLDVPSRTAYWGTRAPDAVYDRSNSWPQARNNSYGSSPSATGRADDCGPLRSRGDNDSWAPQRLEGGSRERSLQDTGISAGRSSWARYSGRDSSNTGSWNEDSGSRDRSYPSERSSRASKKDVPCKYYAQGYCKRGETCVFRHS